MSRFHQLSGGKSGSGVGSAPPCIDAAHSTSSAHAHIATTTAVRRTFAVKRGMGTPKQVARRSFTACVETTINGRPTILKAVLLIRTRHSKADESNAVLELHTRSERRGKLRHVFDDFLGELLIGEHRPAALRSRFLEPERDWIEPHFGQLLAGEARHRD